MSARENLLNAVGFADAMNLGSEPEVLVDAYRTEVLADAADRIEQRAAQLDAGWLRADQIVDALRRLAEPMQAPRTQDGNGTLPTPRPETGGAS
ncbi:hypothetical protein [Streptomyces sp. SID2119]|uniref:hypothetical protein n=1 Tax=Streptomyces sp. SID2119 TaxID=2690253 RepID=UPI00136FA6CA|nr:hypothetical protein [Streptomyces sp. SID2119]MYW30140.1 hypothetical protein [Streptomyces sp. SID2119]